MHCFEIQRFIETQMAIQAQNQIGFGTSEFSLINNNGGIGIDQSQTMFHQQQQQQYRSQSFLDVHMEKQRQEIDTFIRLQNERLRYVLQEQRKQEMEMILRRMETKALVLMSQKEEEMLKAMKKNMELEDLLKKMEIENQTWQRIARENEALVVTLNSTIQQVKERGANATCHDATEVEDEGSCCGGGGEDIPVKKLSSCCCWNCGSNGETRVLFLPCRHLCCCIECEDGLVLCPICNTPKKNRIEAFIF